MSLIKRILAERDLGHSIRQYAPLLGEARTSIRMPFGAHRGKPITEVPGPYLVWLSEQPWLESWPEVARYVRHNLPALEQEPVLF